MERNLARAFVREMHGYVPGEQPAPGERVVKLNTNENPFGPSPKVLEAIRNIDPEMLRRYPNPTAYGFRVAAARALNVSADMIICGNGSDDLLNIATRAFAGHGGTIAYPEPTYSLYPVLAKLADAKVVKVPWEAGWSLPSEGLLDAGADAIYIANPNAPSATFVRPGEMEKLAAAFDGLLLIDEAYVDFAEENCLGLVARRDNVLILRTLSKAYSLAGLRFGFGVASETTIAEMNKVKDSYNCDAISVVAATAAIEDQEYARGTWEFVKAERQRVSDALAGMGFEVEPSQANFLWAACPGEKLQRGRALYEQLKAQGVLIRYFDMPGLRENVRITIGTREQNDALLGTIMNLDFDWSKAPRADFNFKQSGS
jgi:histidinol-phosphate aminotransferase